MRNWHNRLIKSLSVLFLVSFLAIQAHAAIWVVGNSYEITAVSAAALPDATCFHLDVTNIDSYFEDTIDNAAAVDKGGGEVGIPITGHNFIAGQAVTIDGTTSYDADEAIVSVTANEIVITATFAVETFSVTDTVKTQEWLNLVTPDGSCTGSKTDYDVFRGVDATGSTDDPTFSGTIGDDAAFLSHDSTDFFTAAVSTGVIFDDMHKTSGTGSGPFWLAYIAQPVASTVGTLWGNTDGGQKGVRLIQNATDNLRFRQDNDGTVFNAEIAATDTTSAIPSIIVLTWDSTSAGSEQFWVNTETGSNWTTSYVPDTVTAENDIAFQIAAADSAFLVASGHRTYGWVGGTGILTDTEMGNMCGFLETEHNRDYDGNSTIGTCD